MAWWQNPQALGAGSGPHPSQMAALTGSGGGFWGGQGLPPDHPLVAGGLGLGLGLLRGAQPGGGGLGSGLGAGIGGLAQGLLTSHMMRQQGRDDDQLSNPSRAPGEVAAPPVAGNPPSPVGNAASGNGAPPTALLPEMPKPQSSPQSPSPSITGVRPAPVSPPLVNAPPAGAPPPVSAAPPPVPMPRPQVPQLPMPGMGQPPPSPVGGMLLNQHMQNPGIGGPRMGPPPMAGGMPPIANFTGGMGPVDAPPQMGMGPPSQMAGAPQMGMGLPPQMAGTPMPQQGMQRTGMGVGGMNPNDIMGMPPHLRDQFIRNFAATRGGMF